MKTTRRIRSAVSCAAVSFAAVLCLLGSPARTDDRYTGPWDLEALSQPPRVTWLETSGTVRPLYYSGDEYKGGPTRVFAYCAFPDLTGETEKRPGMVLVHGGGGTAFREWAELWAKRGYVAIAMDLSGRGPDGKALPDGAPLQTHEQKFDDLAGGVKNAWPYHAVGNVIRAVSLICGLPSVYPERVGITGISWGGYLTCIVAGLDPRLKVAVPVYGCGFLHENSAWLNEFKRLGPDLTRQWVESFDPSRYLPGAAMPTLFVNGTNDFAYPLDSYQKSYRSVRGRRTLCVTVRMPHGHPQGWAPKEIGLFVDSVLGGGKPLALVGEMTRTGDAVHARVSGEVRLASAALHYTSDGGEWKDRNWQSTTAALRNGEIIAELPASRPLVYFLTVTDERGAVVSTEHEILERL